MDNEPTDDFTNFVRDMWQITYDENKMQKDCKAIWQLTSQLDRNHISNHHNLLREYKILAGRYYYLNEALFDFISVSHGMKATYGSDRDKELKNKLIAQVESTVSDKYNENDFIDKADIFFPNSPSVKSYRFLLSYSMLSYSMLYEFIYNFNPLMENWDNICRYYYHLNKSDFQTWPTKNNLIAGYYAVKFIGTVLIED